MLDDCKIEAMLATTQPEAAKRFYVERLGLQLVEDHQFAIVCEGGGTRLRLQKVATFTPHPFTALGWVVPDLRAKVRALAAEGVVFERFEGMSQDADGVWTPPGTTTGVCWFKDPDGNLLSLNG